MATIIVESAWPSEEGTKLGKLWLEMGEAPEQMKMLWAGSIADLDLCNRGLVIWQCEDSFVADALAYVKTDSARFYVIKGFRYQVNVWTEPADSMKMFGIV